MKIPHTTSYLISCHTTPIKCIEESVYSNKEMSEVSEMIFYIINFPEIGLHTGIEISMIMRNMNDDIQSSQA